ncbi:MAG: hypothetical protein JXB49_04000 [Bacteroidales bacterium]|nr:hypothetical protein [Bacteroidales bacterium]
MKVKIILHYLLLYLLYLAIFLGSITLTALLVSLVASAFTDNPEIIVTLCLIAIWIVMVSLYAIRSRFIYKRRLKKLENEGEEFIIAETSRLKKKYGISILFSSVISGLILYKMRPGILAEVNGGEVKQTTMVGVDDALITALKISLLVILVGFWVYKIWKRKKLNANKIINTYHEKHE